jgi:hypothetical protein
VKGREQVEKGLQELQTFLENYNLKDVAELKEHKQTLAHIYKCYHALLVWHVVLKRITPSQLTVEEYQTFCLFFDECVSDMCQALFLWSHGLYKPSYLILRSSVENFFRCMGFYEHQPILELNATFELIAAIRGTLLVNQSSNSLKLFQQLHQSYKVLCQYVHTSSRKQMSLTTAVGVFPKFEKKEASLAAEQLRKIITTYCAFLCFMFRYEYKRLHYFELDMISDILTPSIRREIMS